MDTAAATAAAATAIHNNTTEVESSDSKSKALARNDSSFLSTGSDYTWNNANGGGGGSSHLLRDNSLEHGADGLPERDGDAMGGSHTLHTTAKQPRRVKHAGKKVLHAVAGRPWKSVRRRFGTSKTTSTYGSDRRMDNDDNDDMENDVAVRRLRQFKDDNNDYSDGDDDLSSFAAGLLHANEDHNDTTTSSMRRQRRPLWEQSSADDAVNSVVGTVEGALRRAMVVLLAAVLGATLPNKLDYILRMTEYVFVAWLTCAAILLLSWRRQRSQQQQHPHHHRQQQQQQLVDTLDLNESVPLLQGQVEPRTTTHTLEQHYSEKEMFEPRDSQSTTPSKDETLARLATTSLSPIKQRQQPQPPPHIVHPSLENFYVIETASCARANANSMSTPFPLDSEFFKGVMLVMIRTPDCDSDQAPKGSLENKHSVDYFRDKQRRFEFQFQVKLKKKPRGRAYFACELADPVKIGLIQRAFVSAAMAFIKSTNANFHYSLSGTTPTPDGTWEPPHMAFPVEEGLNRVVITPPGEEPPPLGQDIVEDEQSIKQRKKGMVIDWNTEDTYTLSLWSAYADFLDWRCLNLPGIRPFSLAGVIGPQPIIVTLYELLPDDDGESSTRKNHFRKNIVEYVKLEMSNTEHSRVGPATEKWMASNHVAASPPARSEQAIENGAESGEEFNGNESTCELFLEDELDDGGLDEDMKLNEEAAVELGEGIYVRCVDKLSLRESAIDGEDGGVSNSAGFVTNGGGFAVLQEGLTSSSTIVVQKAGKSRVRKNARSSSRLIKSGDTVIIKLLEKGRNDDIQTNYLSIHRGWWLKWVPNIPTKNGYFQIHTHETEFTEGIEDESGRSAETQSSYLTLGGSFWLRHKRWSRYRVGVATDASATYGGRMLGLHIPTKNGGCSSLGGDQNVTYLSDDGGKADLDVESSDDKSNRMNWIKPLQFMAFEGAGSGSGSTDLKVQNSDDPAVEETKLDDTTTLQFSDEQYTMDVPAWVEVLDRKERIRQHAYVLRVLPPKKSDSSFTDSAPLLEESEECGDFSINAFVRLRKGRDLAHVLRVGLKWRSNVATPRRKKQSDSDFSPASPSKICTQVEDVADDGTRARSSSAADEGVGLKLNVSNHSMESSEQSMMEDDSEFSDEEWDGLEGSGIDRIDSIDELCELADLSSMPMSRRQGKGRVLMGKVARSVKTKTSSAARATGNAGKKVVTKSVKGTVSAGKATVNVGKATVNAGKAMLPIRPKKPPAKEPKSGKKERRRRRDTGLRVDVNSRSIKRVEQLESHDELSDVPMFLAGELSAPEQSRRTVSSMISKMSTLEEGSEGSASFNSLLSPLVTSSWEHDTSFLQGGAAEVGVTPQKRDKEKGSLILGALVARCLWESHWREEWCGLYQKSLVWYAPLTDTPCLELSLVDITSTRLLEPVVSPLAGYPLIVVETAWSCHYIALKSVATRQNFYDALTEICGHPSEDEAETISSSREQELSEARFWQGFETSIQSSHSVGGEKWARVASGARLKSRTILNTRCMVFDLPHFAATDLSLFVEDLLSTVLSFSLDSLKEHPEVIVEFLVSVSNLRSVSLEEVDFDSPEAYCTFVNLYHCLLQHALLFSVNGVLQKRSFNHFMRTTCYEIGGDVFSLAELHCFIIRGNMAEKNSAKPPFVDAPRKSMAYQFYALRFVHPNTHFMLNTAHAAWPRSVPVLNVVDLEEQLEVQAASFIREHVSVDVSKKVVILPKIFEVYRNDFSADSSLDGHVLYCLRYLDGDVASKIRTLLEDSSPLTVKFQGTADSFYSSLTESTRNNESATQLAF